VAPIDKLSVVLVALFGVVFLGERPSLNGWLGIALIARRRRIDRIQALITPPPITPRRPRSARCP